MFKKNYFLLVICGVFVLPGCSPSDSTKTISNQVCFKTTCVEVEVVSKKHDLARGLQFRQSLPENHGMLFLFPTSDIYSFWMKDTFIALDMIWLDHGRRIVHVESHVPPCPKDPCPSYTPQKQSMYVLEVNAGYATKHGIKVGDVAEFRLESNSK